MMSLKKLSMRGREKFAITRCLSKTALCKLNCITVSNEAFQKLKLFL